MSKNKTFYFDYTMLSAFLRCRFYYYFRHVRHLVPKVTKAPLSFGQTWHSATELLAKGKTINEAQLFFKSDYKNETKDQVRTPERGALMLKVYQEKYEKAPIKFLYTETPFAIHFPDNIIMCGRMDGIVEWQGGVYVFERKTTSQLGSTFFEKFELNYQIDCYCLGCMELVGACNGAIIDAARVCKPAPNIITDFARDVVSRTKNELVLAKKNIIEIVEDMQHGPMYQNKDACMQYNQKCQYYDLCMGACDERIVHAMYEVSKWDPSHGLKAKTDEAQLKLFEEEKKEGDINKTLWNSIIEIDTVNEKRKEEIKENA